MNAQLIVAGLLALAVLIAWVRLILWHRATQGDLPSKVWRVAALLALQLICAALLYLCLFPPAQKVAAGTLIVATAGTERNANGSAGAHFVSMPEAPALSAAQPLPDLGAALRLYPGVTRITVLGEGLTPRDRDAARGVAVTFVPPTPRPGLVSLDPPARTAPGAGFSVGGQVAAVPGATVELLDPAGRVTDRRKADDAGWFTLSGTARAAGPATFVVRLRDSGGRQVEQADVPVLVDSDAAPRLLIMAGAPGPEVKYLRRWATDAGFAVTTRMSAGGGIELGDAPVAIDGPTLRRFDAAIIDDRSWAGLGGQRAAILGAVREGLGLLLRASGPLDGATRAQWRSLGFALTGGDTLAPIALPRPTDPAIARTRQGIGSVDVPADLDLGDDILPDISRLALVPGGGDAVPLLRDAGGTTLSAWRAIGGGRVAVFTGIDSFGLTLTGRRDLYGDWWSSMVSAIARPVSGGAPAFTGPAWAGERIALCNLTGGDRVEQPDGAIIKILPDPGARRCAAFWPTSPGWYVLHSAGPNGGERLWPFFVQPATALPGVRAVRDRDATLMLRATARETDRTEQRPGPSSPWFMAWLAASALLWWLERSRRGRMAAPA